MIALAVAAVIAIGLFFYAFVQVNLGGKANKTLSVVFCTVGALVMATGLLMYPACNVWQAQRASDARIATAQGDAYAVSIMKEALGSTESYLEYLKAKGG